jgi:hypothetical protein
MDRFMLMQKINDVDKLVKYFPGTIILQLPVFSKFLKKIEFFVPKREIYKGNIYIF